LLMPRLPFTRPDTWAREPSTGTRSTCFSPRLLHQVLDHLMRRLFRE
jgi:hypothetical protein